MESNFQKQLVGKDDKKRDKVLLNIQAVISAIPYVGGFLSTYFGEIRNRCVEERMLKYFQYFSERLQEIDEQKIDHEYLKTDEFAEFFMQGAEQAARSTTDKRIRRFANILINNGLIEAKARSCTQSIMSFVDRISDIDAFVLLSYGHPFLPSLLAKTKKEAVSFVEDLAEFLNVESPTKEIIIESIVYMDNLGITWVNEKKETWEQEKGINILLREFSSFRTPLGDAVAIMIAPPGFYPENVSRKDNMKWPVDYIGKSYQGIGIL